MNLMILGPQGSGKGTQARLLSEKLGLGCIETGALLREIAKTNPQVDEMINKKGQLLPDEETFSFVKSCGTFFMDSWMVTRITLRLLPASIMQKSFVFVRCARNSVWP